VAEREGPAGGAPAAADTAHADPRAHSVARTAATSSDTNALRAQPRAERSLRRNRAATPRKILKVRTGCLVRILAKSFSSSVRHRSGDSAITLAVRVPASNNEISPKKSPAERCARIRPPRTTLARPSSRTKNVELGSPSRITEAPLAYSRTPVTLAIEERCRFGKFANRGTSVNTRSRRARSLAEIRAPGGIGVNGHPRTAGSICSSLVRGEHYASRIGAGATWWLSARRRGEAGRRGLPGRPTSGQRSPHDRPTARRDAVRGPPRSRRRVARRRG
jgi:hypothetical protein